MSDQDPRPTEPPGSAAHRLGPLGFDRADLVYDATGRCGCPFGPLASMVSLGPRSSTHRALVETALDPPGPPGV